MEQHPVPQNISSYEFRLVGDMTLKQFFQLAGGVVLGIFFYRLPIITLVRYPLVFLSVLTGILLAFVPLQGRPFTQWIVAFIRAIYSPTEFTWALPVSPEITPPVPAAVGQSAIPSSSAPAVPPAVKPISLGIFQTLKNIFSGLFSKKIKGVADSLPSTPVPSTTLSKPLASIITPLPSDNPKSPSAVNIPASDSRDTYSLKTPDISSSPSQSKPVVPPPPLPTAQQTTSATIQPQDNLPASAPAASTIFQSSATAASPSFLKDNLTVFESTPAPTTTAAPPKIAEVESAPLPPTIIPGASGSVAPAAVSTAVSAPTSPNILSGMVLDASDKILAGVTIEIVDSATGIPVRALRSNRLGQFQIAIPLPAGSYIINVEKEGYSFDPVAVQVANSIIQPIMIKARHHE